MYPKIGVLVGGTGVAVASGFACVGVPVGIVGEGSALSRMALVGAAAVADGDGVARRVGVDVGTVGEGCALSVSAEVGAVVADGKGVSRLAGVCWQALASNITVTQNTQTCQTGDLDNRVPFWLQPR